MNRLAHAQKTALVLAAETVSQCEVEGERAAVQFVKELLSVLFSNFKLLYFGFPFVIIISFIFFRFHF